MAHKSSLFFLFLSVLFFSCKKEKTIVSTAMYQWQSDARISAEEQEHLEVLGAKKLYVRFFDVDMTNGNPAPKSVVSLDKSLLQYEVIPTIFITNRVMLEQGEVGAKGLAEKIGRKIALMQDSLSGLKIREIQIDCDWSDKSQKAYFALLQSLKQYFATERKQAIALSATIRLHQVKYAERTGVPPIDKGVLMFYNMGDVQNAQSENSILDLKIAKNYLQNFEKYPLHLDIALPAFGWGALFRSGKLINLLEDFAPDSLISGKLSQKAWNTFQVEKSHYYKGVYLYEDDKIRQETVTYQQLAQAVELLKPHLKSDSLSVIFYHLSDENTLRFPALELKKVAEGF